MKHFSNDDIASMEKLYRINFINSLSGFKSANLIGTVDSQGNENLAIFSSVVHLGADPALIGMVCRPRSVERHTAENILQTGYYTINQVCKSIVERAHQTSARYLQDTSEFDEVGLTPVYRDDFHAPFVTESQVSLAVKFVECKHLEVNNTDFMIGEIQQVYLKEDVVCQDGYIDIEALETVTVSGLNSYHATQKMGRLSYAKPDKPVDWE